MSETKSKVLIVHEPRTDTCYQRGEAVYVANLEPINVVGHVLPEIKQVVIPFSIGGVDIKVAVMKDERYTQKIEIELCGIKYDAWVTKEDALVLKNPHSHE